MSRSLAFVGILTIVTLAGTWSAIGQDNTSQTSQGVVVKNHMSDSERDRLMQEAMEQARRELEQEKALQQAEQESQTDAEKRKAEAAAARERAAAAAEQEKRRASAAAEQKAKEERLAAELAEAEKQASEKKAADAEPKAGEAYDLDALQPLKSSKLPAKQTASEPAVESEKSSAEASKPSTASKKKTPEVAKSKPREEQKAEPEKIVIETVSTKQPGSGLSVKTNMPAGDSERKAEQQRAAAGHADRGTESRSNRDMNISGVVVGMLRSSGGPPRILVNTADRRMVQVVIENSGADIPAAGARVSVSGREIGGADGRPVISASSVNIKSGQAMSKPKDQTPQVAAAPVPVVPPPRFMGPPPPIIGHMPPPMPMLPGGPGMMLPPPPPF